MKQKQKTEMAIAIPLVLILGFPVAFALSYIIAMGGSVLIGLVLMFLKIERSRETQANIILFLRITTFLLIYLGMAAQAIAAIIEGEGVFRAFSKAVISPLFNLLKIFTGKA